MVLNEIFLMSFSYTTNTNCPSGYPEKGVGVEKEDIDKMQFAVNLEFLEAEYFSSYGFGLDVVAPNLPMSGPPPIGARKANLDQLTTNIIMEFANQEVGHLRNKLGKCGIKDEGIYIQPPLGAENRTSSNILSADFGSLSYKRTPAEILRIVYGSGDEHVPGGFYPKGANGKIAKEFLKIIK
ncbi:ferritin-like catalase Nec2 [Solanum lycopersicum]